MTNWSSPPSSATWNRARMRKCSGGDRTTCAATAAPSCGPPIQPRSRMASRSGAFFASSSSSYRSGAKEMYAG